MSRPFVKKTPRAYADLEQAADYLQNKVNAKLALRFLDSAETTFQRLAQMPSLGAVCEIEGADQSTIRTWQIKGFDKYIVFYRELRNGIEVIRVLHGAQDWQSHFEDEPLT